MPTLREQLPPTSPSARARITKKRERNRSMSLPIVIPPSLTQQFTRQQVTDKFNGARFEPKKSVFAPTPGQDRG